MTRPAPPGAAAWSWPPIPTTRRSVAARRSPASGRPAPTSGCWSSPTVGTPTAPPRCDPCSWRRCAQEESRRGLRAARRRPRPGALRRLRGGHARALPRRRSPTPSARSSTSPGPTRCWSARTDDWNDDHRLVHLATCRALAARRYGGRVGAYPVWFWADGPWRNAPWEGLGPQLRTLAADPVQALRLPAPWLVSTAGYVDLKRAAYGRYLSQVTNLTGEPTWQVFPDELDRAVPRPGRAVLPRRPRGRSEAGGPAAEVASGRPTTDDGLRPAPASPSIGTLRAGCGTSSTTTGWPARCSAPAPSSGATPPRRRRRGHDRHRQPRAAPGDAGHARLRPPGADLRPLRAPAGPHPGGPGPQQPQHRAVEHPGRGSQGPAAPARPRPAPRAGPARARLQLEPAARRRQPGRRLLARRRPSRPPGRGNAFVMHAASTVNGELRARAGAGRGPPPPGRPERADHVPGLPAGAGRGLLRRLGAGRRRHGHAAGAAPGGHRPRRRDDPSCSGG